MSAAAQEVADRTDVGAEAQFAIEVEGLTVSYGRTRVVRDLSMHVPHASIYGLVGPSGAGKSTVIRTLATLQKPDAGTITVDGIDLAVDPAAVRDRIGYLPDFAGVYDGLTVAEYLDYFGALYRVPPRHRRQVGDELLELIGLTERRSDPVGTLSRGMKQKLGLARCLIHDPDVLLLDEPASGLDPSSRLELRDILQELARLGKAILVGSNRLSDLAELCSHLGVMQDGELIAEASVPDMMSAIFPESYLRVRLLDAGDGEAAERLITAHPACRRVETVDVSTLLASFDGGEDDLASILGQLLRSGIRITGYTLERPTLEDVYERLTAEETAE